MLYLAVGWAMGLVVCVGVARAIIVRYRLPWRATLMYFGLVPYPDEVQLPRIRGRAPVLTDSRTTTDATA